MGFSRKGREGAGYGGLEIVNSIAAVTITSEPSEKLTISVSPSMRSMLTISEGLGFIFYPLPAMLPQ